MAPVGAREGHRGVQLKPEQLGPGSSPLLLSVAVAAVGFGVSLVSDAQELAYLQLGGLQLGVSVSVAQAAVVASLGQLRIDNSLLDATHPIALCCPVSYSLLGQPQPDTRPAWWSWADSSAPQASLSQGASTQDLSWQGSLGQGIFHAEQLPCSSPTVPHMPSSPSYTHLPSARPHSSTGTLLPARRTSSTAQQQQQQQQQQQHAAPVDAVGRSSSGGQLSLSRSQPSSSWSGLVTAAAHHLHLGGGPATPGPHERHAAHDGAPAAKQPAAAEPALSLSACLWLHRPGGVLCVQQVGLQLAPLALNLEEAHVRSLAGYGAHMWQLLASSQQRFAPLLLQLPASATACAVELPCPAATSMLGSNMAAAGPTPQQPLAFSDVPLPPPGAMTAHAPMHLPAPRGSSTTPLTDMPSSTSPAMPPPSASPTSIFPALDVSVTAQRELLPMCPWWSRAAAGAQHAHAAPWEPQVSMLADPLLLGVLQQPKIYMDSLSISRIRLALSFVPEPWSAVTSLSGHAASLPNTPRAAAAFGTPLASPWRSSTAAHAPQGTLRRTAGLELTDHAAPAGPHIVSPGAPRLGYHGQRGAASAAGPVAARRGHAAGGGGMAAIGGPPAGGGLVRLLLPLAHLEGAWLTLKPLQLRHPLLSSDGLAQLLGRHYMTAALLQLALALGSLDIFGDVTRLVQAWGLGVWHLLALPAQGAMRGGLMHGLHGFLRGVLNFMHTTTSAAFNSVLKYMRRGHNALLALCPMEVIAALSAAALPTPLYNPRSMSHAFLAHTATTTIAHGGHGSAGGREHWALMSPYKPALARDAMDPSGTTAGEADAGVVQAPLLQPSHALLLGVHAVPGGSPGPLRALSAGYGAVLANVNRELSLLSLGGLLHQAPAVLLMPLIVVLKQSEAVVASLQEALTRSSRPRRMRVPRFVDPGQPLQRYNWLESYCRLLQQHVAGGLFSSEAFEGCIALCGGQLGIVTRTHLLCVVPQHANETREAELLFVVPLDCLLHATQAGRQLVLVLLQPGSITQRHLCCAAALQHTTGGLLPPVHHHATSALVTSSGVQHSHNLAPVSAQQHEQRARSLAGHARPRSDGGAHAVPHSTGSPFASHTHDPAAATAAASVRAGVHPSLQAHRHVGPAPLAGGLRVRLGQQGMQPMARTSSWIPREEDQAQGGPGLKMMTSMALPGAPHAGMAHPPTHASPPGTATSTAGGSGARGVGAQAHLHAHHGTTEVRLRSALSIGSVPGWAGVVRLACVSEEGAREVAALLRCLVRMHEEQAWAGGCSLQGFTPLA